MKLFAVPDGKRVRITSKLIRFVEHRQEQVVAEDVTFEAVTTNKYFFYKNAHRRLLVNHNVSFWKEYGIWQRDTKIELLEHQVLDGQLPL